MLIINKLNCFIAYFVADGIVKHVLSNFLNVIYHILITIYIIIIIEGVLVELKLALILMLNTGCGNIIYRFIVLKVKHLKPELSTKPDSI